MEYAVVLVTLPCIAESLLSLGQGGIEDEIWIGIPVVEEIIDL